MLPRCIALVLIVISSAFILKAQDRAKTIPLKFTSLAAKVDTLPCFCSVSPQINSLGGTENSRTYEVAPNAVCAPFTSPGSSSASLQSVQSLPDTCQQSISYLWHLIAGAAVATIDSGNISGTRVRVSRTGVPCVYTLQVDVTVICGNTSCTNSATITDSIPGDSSHCTCTAGAVTIQPTNKQGNLWTYTGSVAGNCTGQSGIPPNTQSCQVQNTLYQWSIVGNGVAAISGATNGQTVNVAVTGNGPFSLRLDGTTVCSDGKQCTNYNFYEDSAKVSQPKSCNCSVDVDCQRGPDAGSMRTYNGVLKGGCTGEYGQLPPYQPCNIKNVTWSWQISSGANVVEIVGPSNQQTVNIRIKGTGSYELRVQADVECSDGTKSCGESNFDYCRDSASNEKSCNLNVEEKVEPLMDGGLRQRYVGSQKIERDGYIILGAIGADYDQAVFTCNPSSDCNETNSKRTVILNSRVRFLWSIVGGEGGFVSLGSLPDAGDDQGDHVIFKPPFVPLPQGGANENSKTTLIKLFVFDDNPTQPEDPLVQKTITVVTKRFKASPDYYTVVVEGPVFKPPNAPSGSLQQGTCKISEPTWTLKADLKKPDIKVAPNVPDNDKMVIGEWAVLFATDQRDGDKLEMKCTSTCTTLPFEKIYEDNVAWEWTVLGGGQNGRIVSEPNGRFVVYEAPDKLPAGKDMIEVKVQVTLKNADALKATDAEQKGEIILKVYRAGVKLDFPPLNWVPEENNEAQLRSYLVYRDTGEWRPALAHQARIHYFELLDVSKEPGNCLNDPLPANADKCRDLLIGEAPGHERSDQNVQTCGGMQLYEKARTTKPVKEYTINIRSRDFGSYGFLTSEASLKNKPNYESVPVNYADFPHPTRAVNNPKQYKDNRVSIPRDIDDNHIADGGWPGIGGVTVPDPANNKEDDDNTPNGDGYNGDGLTAYEEYRGFKTITNGVAHVRTNTARKDLFVHSADNISVNLFRQQSGLVVHEINASQYNGNARRVVNFNFTNATHNEDQLGLHLRNGGFNATLLGIQVSTTNPQHPAPPNWTTEIIVYVDRITTFCTQRNLSFSQKLLQVAAHELAHGCNVYHHGEGDAVVHGTRSGDMACIMRYDNVLVLNPPEAIGSIFCSNTAGTGANANNPCITPPCFGSANTDWCRGACLTQFRVSGRQNNYKLRLNANCKNN